MPSPGTAHPPLLAVWLWTVAAILWATWSPFSLRTSGPIGLVIPTNPAEVVANLILWVPVGLIAAERASRRPVTRAFVAGATLSLLVEAGQLFIETRIVSPADILLNTVGAGVGALVSRRFLDQRARRSAALAGAGLLSLITWMIALSSAAGARRALELEDWSPAHQVLAGEEAGGIRVYEGEVRSARLCTPGAGSDLCIEPGADLAERRRFVEEALRNQTFSMSATVLSHSDEQTGPTRILTFSDGAVLRNATLGQERRALIFRLQRPAPDPSRIPEFRLPNAIREGELTMVTATFERGEITLEAVSPTETRTASLVPGFLRSQPFSRDARVLPLSLLTAKAAVAALVLFLPVGALVRLLGATSAGAFRPVVAALAFVVPSALLLGCDWLAGAGPVLTDVLFAGFAGLSGFAASRPRVT